VEPSDFEHVLWLGGMSGVGKTTNARAVARKFDLRFYSLDSYTLDHHRNRVRPAEHPALTAFDTLSDEELWVQTTGREIADRFEAAARERFPFVLDDLVALPRDAPILAEGPQLLPELVAWLLPQADHALYLVADSELQRRLVAARGGTSYERSSDPDRAANNRAERDRILSERARVAATRFGLAVQEVRDPADAPTLIETHFRLVLDGWDGLGERGDVSVRRRDENDARLRQWRMHADNTGQTPEVQVPLACECDNVGCNLTVLTNLRAAEAARAGSQRLIAPAHRLTKPGAVDS
jgi:adenylate kinase family enzyme